MIHFFKPQPQLNAWGPWIHFEKFLSPYECTQIVQQMTKDKMVNARVSEDGKENSAIRSAEVCSLEFTPNNRWLFRRLEEAISECNQNTYKYDLAGFHEAIQLIRYDVGDFYDWHMDFSNLQYSRRKLSIVVQLTNPSEYEGGDLEFFRNGTAPKDQGALILFPSFMYHNVQPLTKGVRRSLVAWISGDPYK